MKRTISAISLTFILILTGISFPISSIELLQNKSIYVDDNNTEGPWDGSPDHPFQYIQDGIDFSYDGDTVFVYSGVYDENIQISTQIHLVGLDKENTIISVSNSSEFLLLDSVNFSDISNLTFSCINDERVDIVRMINCNHCTIYNADIISQTLQHSAILVNGSFNIIENVTIKGGYFFTGVELFYGDYNTIKNNSVESCNGGIHIFRSNNNMISSNEITNCTNGIYIEEVNQNSIISNVMKKNGRGIFSSYSSRNLIEKNNFIDNEEHAKFTKFFHQDFMISNKWQNNYWDDWIGFGIKVIPGIMYIPNSNLIGFFIPWIELDRNPAKLSDR